MKDAHPHRFRHTLASELLGKGGGLGKVAGILGDSAATISRYYAKWTPEYQTRQEYLIRTIHGTNWHRHKDRPLNVDTKRLIVVARDGIEPPTPAFSGLLTDTAKWFRISAGDSWKRSSERVHLGLIGMI